MSKLDFIEIDSVNLLLDELDNLEYKALLVREVKKMFDRQYLDFEKTKKEINEIENVSVRLSDYELDDTDLGICLRVIGDIDQYRSRLSTLLSQAQGDMDYIEEKVSRLYKVWTIYSKQSSADKREGEAEKILFFLIEERQKRKEIYNLIKSKFGSMNHKMEAISRKITIIQEISRFYKGQHHEFETDGPFRARKKEEEIIEELKEELKKTGEPKSGWDNILEEVLNDDKLSLLLIEE